jgi:hypothetical protein
MARAAGARTRERPVVEVHDREALAVHHRIAPDESEVSVYIELETAR